MKIFKYIALLTIMTMFLVACSKEETPTTPPVEKGTEVSDEQVIKNVKDYTRPIVSEFLKMYFMEGEYRKPGYIEGKLGEMLPDKEAVQELNAFAKMSSYTDNVELRKLTFNEQSEKVIVSGNNYYYQVTPEVEVAKNGKVTVVEISYFVLLGGDGSTFELKSAGAEEGHLVDGHKKLTSVGKNDVVQQKITSLFENTFYSKEKNKEKALNNLNSIFSTTELVSAVQNQINPLNTEKSIISVTFDNNKFSAHGKFDDSYSIGESIFASGIFEVNYGQEKETYTFNVVMSQKNPSNAQYEYVFKQVTLSKTN